MDTLTIRKIFGGKVSDAVDELISTCPQWITDYDVTDTQSVCNTISLERNMLDNFADQAVSSDIAIKDLPDFQSWVKQLIPTVISQPIDKNWLGEVSQLNDTTEIWMDDQNYDSICRPGQMTAEQRRACDLFKAGNHVLLQVTPRSGEYKILSVVDSNGNVVTGDPNAKANRAVLRVQRGLYKEPTIIKLQSEFGDQGVKPFMQAVRNVIPGIVRITSQVGMCGGSYVGNGKFITAAHCVGPIGSSVTVGTQYGTLNGKVTYRGQPATDNDVAVVKADIGPLSAYLKPVPMADQSSPYGVAITGLYSEGDLLTRSGTNYYDVNRYRKGYSGGPLIDSLGRIIGISSTVGENYDLNKGRNAGFATLGNIKKALK